MLSVIAAEPVKLDLISSRDSRAAKALADVVQRVVDGTQQPNSAAQLISEIVIDDCEVHLSRTGYHRRDPNLCETYEVCNSTGMQDLLWDYLGRAAMLMPSTHSGQTNLISLVVALKNLPRRKVAARLSDDKLYEVELWTLNKKNGYAGFAHWLLKLEQVYLHENDLTWKDDASTKFINIATLLAGLAGVGVVDTTRLCTMARLDFRTINPSDRTQNTNLCETLILAAAQWIRHAGPALFEMCEKKALADASSTTWTKASWAAWKQKFNAVLLSKARFYPRVCEAAAESVSIMEKVEQEGVTTNVVETLQLLTMFDDDEEIEL
ncbi:hypothetical protein K461DRAFT_278437 [Myriangium duriaei CBS 260.36]|uniref:Uncharacterized protein n=1 Tax=Myriangium duriaei CBS 260.36 TaxID=1168546 RepID=A0A9P4J0N1_9PEZI|nr:hypothetical protein K461DRAFT_278437 [Myriangium duriaei CBS 260.36]